MWLFIHLHHGCQGRRGRIGSHLGLFLRFRLCRFRDMVEALKNDVAYERRFQGRGCLELL